MNNRSLPLGKISGIPIFVHWSFVAVLFYAVYIGVTENYGVWGTIWYLMLILTVFGCILLHELGHSFSARKYGIGTEDITLLPIGGLARLERMPRQPVQELVIALMGPAVNVVIAIVLGVMYTIFYGSLIEFIKYPGSFTFDAFIAVLVFVNGLLVLFNMIPAFPMDGGRVLRALLSFKLSYVKATRIASLVGKFAALCFIVYGFFRPEIADYLSPGTGEDIGRDYILMAIGAFIFFSANMENKMVQMEGALEGHTVNELIRNRFTVFQTTDTVGSALKTMSTGLEQDFLVLIDKKVEGIVTKSILTKYATTNPDLTLGEVMRTDIGATDPEQPLSEALEIIQGNHQPIVPVFDQITGLLLGVLDHQTLFNFMQLKKSGGN